MLTPETNQNPESIAKSSINLTRNTVEIFDSIVANRLPSPERELADEVSVSLLNMTDSLTPLYAVMRKRSPKDRRIIPAYEHPGVNIATMSKDYQTIILNVYGGLRILSGSDLRDRDSTLSVSHVSRTEEVVDQETYINIHTTHPNGDLRINIWLMKYQNNFFIDKIYNEGKYIDLRGKIDVHKSPYSDLRDSFVRSLKDLTSQIGGF